MYDEEVEVGEVESIGRAVSSKELVVDMKSRAKCNPTSNSCKCIRSFSRLTANCITDALFPSWVDIVSLGNQKNKIKINGVKN